MILVLGGTTEGRELAWELHQNGYPCLLSVVSELGAKMINNATIRIQVGELDSGTIKELVQREKIQLVLDATHPYAAVIKEIARNAAAEAGIIYGRFERESALLPDDPKVVAVEDYNLAVEVLQKDCGGILLTIGVKNLYRFKVFWTEPVRPVWVKVYPEVKSLEVCKDLGLEPEQIFAFHGFGNKEILKAIIEMTGVSWIVTKESGSIGGIDVKVAATLEMGKKILVIKRPLNEAGLMFQNTNEIIEFIKMKMKIM
jgi:precorrin-6A/cobalt-precorrin-6A reductase